MSDDRYQFGIGYPPGVEGGEAGLERKIRIAALKRVKLSCQTMMSAALLDQIRVENGPDMAAAFMGDQIAQQLHAFLYGGKPQEQHRKWVQRPRSWWEGFKLAAGEWLSRRGFSEWGKALVNRVQYESITVTYLRQHLCPHLNVASDGPDLVMHLDWLEQPDATQEEVAPLRAALRAIEKLTEERTPHGMRGLIAWESVARIAREPAEARRFLDQAEGTIDTMDPGEQL